MDEIGFSYEHPAIISHPKLSNIVYISRPLSLSSDTLQLIQGDLKAFSGQRGYTILLVLDPPRGLIPVDHAWKTSKGRCLRNGLLLQQRRSSTMLPKITKTPNERKKNSLVKKSKTV